MNSNNDPNPWSDENRAKQNAENKAAKQKEKEEALKKKEIADRLREGKIKKAEKRAQQQQKKLEREAQKNITQEDIDSLKRPALIYNYETKSYTEDPSLLMHTLESARLELEKKSILEIRPTTLWLDSHKSYLHKYIICGLDFKFAPLPDKQQTKNLSNPNAWQALAFAIGEDWEVFPVPPPPGTEGTPPIINDLDWDEVLDASLEHILQRNIPIRKLTSKLPLPILNIEDLDMEQIEAKKSFPSPSNPCQKALVDILTELGLLEYDGYYEDVVTEYKPEEMEGGVGSLMFRLQQTDTYAENPEKLVDHDPRVFWRDLKEYIQDKNDIDQLRYDIQKLANLAFLAGAEATKNEMLFKERENLNQGKKMNRKGKPKNSTILLDECLKKYREQNPKSSKPSGPKEFSNFIKENPEILNGEKQPSYSTIQRFLSKPRRP